MKNIVNTYLRKIITQKKEQKRISIKSFLISIISIINFYFLLILISIFEDNIVEGERIIFENLKELSIKLHLSFRYLFIRDKRSDNDFLRRN